MDDIYFEYKESINNENNINNNYDRLECVNSFECALSETEGKLFNLIKNSDSYKDSNIIKEVLDENINIIPIFKQTKFVNSFINDLKKKYNTENINYIKSNNNIDNKLSNCDNINEKNNNIINNSSINQKNKNILENSLSYNIKKEHYSPKINVQNIFVDFQSNLNNISSRINTKNNLSDNNLLLNINSDFNVNNMKFIGNKRNLENKNIEKTEKENIYDKIKELFYNVKNKSKESENKIIENSNGFFKKNEIVVMDNKYFCIINLDRQLIKSIYLINEEEKIADEQGIIEILKKIIDYMIKKIES